MRRVVYVVLDGVGIGALPDADEYGDEGSDTLGNVSRTTSLRLPFLEALGLGNIRPLVGVPPRASPKAFVARLAPLSVGKDSTVGHWEQMGLVTSHAFPTYPEGFPDDVIGEFMRRIGRGILGNRTASGTQIVAMLGDEHVATGRPIVYTSADSVFQIAAHVDVVALETLYSWCRTAREILTGEHGVARVIARPFAGRSGAYTRTPDRMDLSLPPPGKTYLDRLSEGGVPVRALGKISEIFAGRGIESSVKVSSNDQNLALLQEMVGRRDAEVKAEGVLIMSNLVDFDMLWGHRNDVEAFAQGLVAADAGLRRIADMMGDDDRLVITADHGVDPTTPSTDHSREYVPALVYPTLADTRRAVYEGVFADVGAFTYEYLTGRAADLEGTSFSLSRPVRGWSGYTAVQSERGGSVAGMPGRVGHTEARAAARWLQETLGPAPAVAVVLGSGLSLNGVTQTGRQVAFREVPHWLDGQVVGHPCQLTIGVIEGVRCALVQGRVHEYEGADLSEVQLPIRSLSAWGVSKVILTTTAGAVAQDVTAGQVLMAQAVFDLQYRQWDGRPSLLEPTLKGESPGAEDASPEGGLGRGGVVHASVPGPQYETRAELDVLRTASVATVSMSPAGELRAAIDEGMRAAVLAAVTNAGSTTHTEVLGAAKESVGRLTAAVTALCKELT